MKELRQVVTSDGVRGFTVSDEQTSADARYVRVRFDSGQVLLVPIDLLEPRTDGLYHLPLSLTELESRTRGLETQVSDTAVGQDRIVVPVVAEEIDISRRVVTTGVVRVHKHVQERAEIVDEPILREEVVVERVPIDRVVDVMPTTHNEGDTLVIPVVEEVLVVEKRVLLKEEVRITKRAVREQSTQEVTLRSEQIEVERTPLDGQARLGDERSEGR